MLRFWIYKISRILLGVVAVSLITHFAIEKINIDPISRLLETNETTFASPEFRIKEYKRIQQLLGYDHPAFYFSINTLADNATPQVADQKLFNAISPYLAQASDALAFIKNIPEDERENWSKVQSRVDFNNQLNSGNLKTQNLITKSQWRHFIPTFSWHGIQNRYHHWMSNIFRGDFGYSQTTGLKVSDRVSRAIQWSSGISFLAYIITFALAILLGILLAIYGGPMINKIGSSFLLLFYALPVFWLASLAVQYLTGIPHSGGLDLFATVGQLNDCDSIWSCLINNRYQLILPLICLVIPNLAFAVEQVRKSYVHEINSRSTHYLYSLGISKSTVTRKYLSRRALTPIITTMGLAFPAILTGSIIIEVIFNIPGLGRLFYSSLINEDWMVVRTVVVLSVSLSILGFALSDFLYALINPRLRTS